MKNLSVITIVILILGCGNQNEAIIQDRILHVYTLDSLRHNYDYQLKIFNNDSIIKYSYENVQDKEKNMVFVFDAKRQILQFADDEFQLSNSNRLYVPQIKDYYFNFYHNVTSSTDATNPIFFNEEYGVLGMGNIDAPNFVYLMENDSEVSRLLNNKL